MNDLIRKSESYMNDLIRRKDVLALFPTNDCSDKMVGLYERVLDIPAAYDVSKVVEEFEKESKWYIVTQDGLNFGEKAIRKDKAVDIVKRGG